MINVNRIGENMRNNMVVLTSLIILLIITFSGCIIRSNSYAGYSVWVWPEEDSEISLIIPVVINNNSGEIDQIMFVDPRFPKGRALLEIVETDKGPGLKIETQEELEIDFSKNYKESGTELRVNMTLSMTNISYDEETEQKNMVSWIYLNSTTNQTPHFWISLSAGDSDISRTLGIGERNLSNGWHQLIVEEGIAIA